jgi:hypothetical protein
MTYHTIVVSGELSDQTELPLIFERGLGKIMRQEWPTTSCGGSNIQLISTMDLLPPLQVLQWYG